MQFDIITIFPDLFKSFMEQSLIAKSVDKKLNKICVHNLRDWSDNKHNNVDDKLFGGGAGMLMMAEPIIKSIDEIKTKNSKKFNKKKIKVVLMSPHGQQFSQPLAQKFSELDNLIFICGRYQGVDARVDKFIDYKISVGPYILSGGELPAMLITEAVARLIPGYLGNPDSLSIEKKFTSDDTQGELPQYTRPEVIKFKNKKYSVPKILLSGNHAEIKKWQEEKMNSEH